MSFEPETAQDDRTGQRPVERAKDGADADIAQHLAVLAELRDIGLDVAKVMKTRLILEAAEGKTDEKAGRILIQVARTVQQVILLHTEISGLREKRRDSLLAQRKAQAKQIVRRAIDRVDAPDASGRQRTEKERAVQRVTLDDLFNGLGDDIFEGLSVAEIVRRACRLFDLNPGPLPPWPEWAEIRAEKPAEARTSASAAPVKAKPVVPAHLSGASTIGLTGRAPPVPPFAGARERAPP